MHDTVLFDVDGTLVTMELDFVTIRKDVDRILVEHGYPEPLLDTTASTLEIIDSAVIYLKEKGLDWNCAEKEAKTYLEKIEIEAASRAVPIQGASHLLKTLKEKSMKVGVITRNNRRVAVQVLKKSGLFQYVDVILARDDVKQVKPHPDHVVQAVELLHSTCDRTVVVGDHRYEIEAGNAAGCFTIGVLTGSGDEETLNDADVVVGSVADVEALLEQET
jgi:phosphoglycolate phosphatase